MKRVTGIGGVFFKSDDPEKLYQWYEKHLDIKREPHGSGEFHWRDAEDPKKEGVTVWAIFPRATKHFGGHAGHMLNYRVDDMDALLKALKEEGVEIDPHREDSSDFGRFAWILDPEGNRIELWEPPKQDKL